MDRNLDDHRNRQQQHIDDNDPDNQLLQQNQTDDPAEAGAAGAKRTRPAPAKTFQCRGFGDCKMVFSRSEHLARHVRKHTGERPFSCHCGKQFSRLDNLRQHAQTVHSDKHAENEIMMRDLTSLHTQLAAKTSKVNRDAFSIAVPTGKGRAGDASSSAASRAGVPPGFDVANATYGPPGLAYQQMPPGFQPPPPHPYGMPSPGIEGYATGGFFPTNAGQPGQPYPSYPPSFGPPSNLYPPDNNNAYPPYGQTQYSPVSPNQYRANNGGMGYSDPNDLSPGPHTPLTPSSTTPLSANSQAGQSFLGPESASSTNSNTQPQLAGQRAGGSFLGNGGPHQHRQAGSPDPRSFTDADGHLAPPQGGANHSFRAQHLASPIPISPISAHSHSTGYDDTGSLAGSDAGLDVVPRSVDPRARGGRLAVGSTSASPGFDSGDPSSPSYLSVNGEGTSNGRHHQQSRPPPGFEHQHGGHPSELSSGVDGVKFEQGFRERGAGWESGFRNPAAASRDNYISRGEQYEDRVAGSTGRPLGFRDRPRDATDSNLSQRRHRDEGFEANKQTEVSPRRPVTGHDRRHEYVGPPHLAHAHSRQDESYHEAGDANALALQHHSGISSQRTGRIVQHRPPSQRQQSRAQSPPELVPATEAGILPPLATIVSQRPGSNRTREHDSPTTPRLVHAQHPGERQPVRDGFTTLRGNPDFSGRPGTAPAAYVADGGYGPRTTVGRPVVSRSGSSRLDGGPSSERMGRDPSTVSEGRRLLPPPPATSAGYRTSSATTTARAPPRQPGLGERRLGAVSSTTPPELGGGLPSFQFVLGRVGKHDIHTSPTSESPFSFHPPDVPYSDSAALDREPIAGLGQFHQYRPTSGRPFSGVSSIGDSSVSSFGGRPSTSSGSVFGGRPYSSGMGHGYGGGRHGLRPGTATSTTDPASYAFSRGVKRPHTADSSDGGSVSGGRDSPHKFASRSGGFGFDRPSTAADGDGRPSSRRLSLMELCTPPASSSGQPTSSSGRPGTFASALRPTTSDGGPRWAGKTLVEESDNDSGGSQSTKTERKSAVASLSQTASSQRHDWAENKSAPADVHQFADSVLCVPQSSTGTSDLSRSRSVGEPRKSGTLSPGAKPVQIDDDHGSLDGTRSPSQSAVSNGRRFSATENQPRKFKDESIDARSPEPIRRTTSQNNADGDFEAHSRSQSVFSVRSGAGQLSPPIDQSNSAGYARSGSTHSIHGAKSDSNSKAVSLGPAEGRAGATPRTVTPSIASEASLSNRRHDLEGSPGMLHNVRA